MHTESFLLTFGISNIIIAPLLRVCISNNKFISRFIAISIRQSDL